MDRRGEELMPSTVFAKGGQGEVERGNQLQRIHDRNKRKVYAGASAEARIQHKPYSRSERASYSTRKRRMLHIAERKRSNASSVKAKQIFMKRGLRRMKRDFGT